MGAGGSWEHLTQPLVNEGWIDKWWAENPRAHFSMEVGIPHIARELLGNAILDTPLFAGEMRLAVEREREAALKVGRGLEGRDKRAISRAAAHRAMKKVIRLGP